LFGCGYGSGFGCGYACGFGGCGSGSFCGQNFSG
jgi:hypothetical protein